MRYDDEFWSDTMRRMRTKLDHPPKIYPIEDWSIQFARRQFRLICRFAQQGDGWPLRLVAWHPPNTYPAAHRKQGRPATRWDDRLNKFTQTHFELDWNFACTTEGFSTYEDDFVRFSHCDDQ